MMRARRFIGLSLLSVLSAFGEVIRPDCVSLEGQPASPNPVGRDQLIHDVKSPVLRLQRTTAASPLGTVLVFPSGGYHVLSVVRDGTDKAAFFNGLGYDAAILEYTISPKGWARDDAVRAAALRDAIAAVRLIRLQGEQLGLRKGRFILMGGSAGGHLVARTVAALDERERPDVLVLFYPAYLEEVPPGGKQAGLPIPEGRLPPLFVTIAADDDATWIKGARGYTLAWSKAGGLATFRLFDDGGHGFKDGSRAAREWPTHLQAFLEQP